MFLPFDKDQTFIEKLIDSYISFGCQQIIIVTNEECLTELKARKMIFSGLVKIIVNDKPGLGRFRSIKLGLEQLASGLSCMIQNIDNPFVNHEVLEALSISSEPGNVVIPLCNNYSGHPVLIGAEVWPLLLMMNNHTNLSEELKKFITIKKNVNNPNILININEPEDYRKYFGKSLS